jgi:hypothetical protein
MLHKIVHSKIVFGVIMLSCAFTFPNLVSWATITKFKSGEMPSGLFFVAVSDKITKKPFRLIPYKEISTESQLYEGKEKSLTIQTDEFSFATYRLLEWSDGDKIVETISRDDDYTFTSRYQIKDRHVVPLTLKVFGPGQALLGLIVAIGFCCLLFYFLRRYINGISSAPDIPNKPA